MAQRLRTLRLAFRQPRRWLASVLALGVSVGISVGTLAALHRLLLDPLVGVEEVEDLFAPHRRWPAGFFNNFTPTQFAAVRDTTDTLAGAAAYVTRPVVVRTPRLTSRLDASFVTPDYLALLGLGMASGRRLADFDENAPVGVIGHAVAKSHFGERDPVGGVMTVNRSEILVIGVLPLGFRGTDLSSPSDVFLPLGLAPRVSPDVRAWLQRGKDVTPFLSVLVRRRHGFPPRRIETALHTRAVGDWANPAGGGGEIALIPLRRAAIPPHRREYVAEVASVGTGLVVLMLVAALGTVMNLALLCAWDRREETAVRLALGARRVRLMRDWLLEYASMMVAGAVVAVLSARMALAGLRRAGRAGGFDFDGVGVGTTPQSVLVSLIWAWPLRRCLRSVSSSGASAGARLVRI